MYLIPGIIFVIAFFYFLFQKRINRWVYLKAVSKSGISQVDSMKGYQFEDFLLTLFKQHRYQVIQTKVTGDFGADLILQRKQKRIVVQAKRYSKKVGVKAIQEAKTAIALYRATEAWVITNNYFTQAATELAKANSIRIINRDELMQLMKMYK